MRAIPISLLFLGLLAAPLVIRAQQALDLAPILRNLASPDFATREAAQRQLDAVSPEEYDALVRLAGTQAGPEVASRLQARARNMLSEWLVQTESAPIRMKAHVTGRIVDPAGKPVAGAWVMANAPAWGPEMEYGLELGSRNRLEAMSDGQGRFDLALPYPGLLYEGSVVCRGYQYYSDKMRVIVQEHTDIGDVTLQPAAHVTIKGTLVDAAGNPVANEKVEILGSSHSGGTAITDAAGRFAAKNVSTVGSSVGGGVAIVHHNGQTVAVESIREAAYANLQLKLVSAGSLSGKVASVSGQAVAGATVRLRWYFMSGMLLTATTGADGSYRFPEVPPGEFIVTAEAPGFTRAAPHVPETRLPRLALGAGEAATRDLTLEPMAIIRGKVVDRAGKPVPDALVGIISTWRNNQSEQYACVQTDAEGRYIVATGHTVEPTNIPTPRVIVFSGAEGMASEPVAKPAAGDLREINVTLPGATHLAGKLVDAGGRGIGGITCRTNGTGYMTLTSAADGSFDFGRISLPADAVPLTLKLEAPRPDAVLVYRSFRDLSFTAPTFTQQKDAPVFYAHQDVPIKPEEAAAQRIAMKPVKLMQFQGTVVNPDGKPVAGAEVYVLTGNANAVTWVESVRPQSLASSYSPTIRDRSLAVGKSDKDGRFNLFAVREEGNATILEADKWDYSHFVIGAWLDKQSALSEKFDMPMESKTGLKITLGP